MHCPLDSRKERAARGVRRISRSKGWHARCQLARIPDPRGHVELRLDSNQATMLGEILESYLGDLRAEIANTDSADFREHLKLRETLIKDVLGQLLGGGSEDSVPD